MKLNNFTKVVGVLAIAGIVGFAATSFAGWGRGSGGNCWGQGGGWDQRDSGAPGYQSNLTDEQITRLDQERRAFFEETRNLRENLYQKGLELRSELAKENPDAQKASGLQAKVSELTAQLDQKRINHRIKMKKEHPEFFAGRGYGWGGRSKGRGFNSGQGMGRGFRGQGCGACY